MILTTYVAETARYLPTMDQWVREALQYSGITQAELGRRMSVLLGRSIDRAAVNKMTIPKGRQLGADEMLVISKITGFQLPKVEQQPATSKTTLVGYVGPEAEIILFGEGKDNLERVACPADSSEDMVAVEIRGKPFGPVFDRWLVYFDQTKRPATPDLIGQLCVCGLADGHILIKQLTRGSIENRYTLVLNFEPPLYDISLDWAAPVKLMRPR